MGANLDIERIAKELGAERRGKVVARGGISQLSSWLLKSRRVFACPKAAAVPLIRHGVSSSRGGYIDGAS
jgi:hypothetical protein